MEFFVVDMTGRHHKITNITSEATILDVKQQLAPVLGLPNTNRIVLVYSGAQCEDTALLSSFGLTAETQASFRMHMIVQREIPASLFDGEPHPFILCDVPIGGPSPYPDIANSPCSIETFLNELQLNQSERQRVDEIEVEILDCITRFEAAQQTKLPSCLKDLLIRKDLPYICYLRLAMNPYVVDADAETDWDEMFIMEEGDKLVFSFLSDHQGCCMWYVVWTPPADGVSEVNDCQIYVQPGGEEFDMSRTTYLTSNHFWQFLTDYARKSQPFLPLPPLDD